MREGVGQTFGQSIRQASQPPPFIPSTGADLAFDTPILPWTNQTTISTVTRASGLTIAWSGSTKDFVQVGGESYTSGSNPVGAQFLCTACVGRSVHCAAIRPARAPAEWSAVDPLGDAAHPGDAVHSDGTECRYRVGEIADHHSGDLQIGYFFAPSCFGTSIFGMWKWPPSSASESRSTGPAIFTTVNSLGSAAMMVTPVILPVSMRK
jgi:hypothetical protein